MVHIRQSVLPYHGHLMVDCRYVIYSYQHHCCDIDVKFQKAFFIVKNANLDITLLLML